MRKDDDFTYIARLARDAREQFLNARFVDTVDPYSAQTPQYRAWEWGWRQAEENEAASR